MDQRGGAGTKEGGLGASGCEAGIRGPSCRRWEGKSLQRVARAGPACPESSRLRAGPPLQQALRLCSGFSICIYFWNCNRKYFTSHSFVEMN